MILKFQEGGDLSPENLDGIIAGEVMPQTSAEAKAAAIKAGQKTYYWNGSTIPLTEQDTESGVPVPQQANPNAYPEEFITPRSKAIRDARLGGQSGYTYGGADLPFPPTATHPDVLENYGGNPADNLSNTYLDSINTGETVPRSRDEAFAAARKKRLDGGEGNFNWQGQSYHSYTVEDRERERRAATPGISKMAPTTLQPPPLDYSPIVRQQDEFQGILRGPEVRKKNRTARKEKRAGKKEARKEKREGRREDRQERKKTRKDFKNYEDPYSLIK